MPFSAVQVAAVVAFQCGVSDAMIADTLEPAGLDWNPDALKVVPLERS